MLPWPTPVHNPNGISIGSAIFAQMTAVSLGMPWHVLSPKNCTFGQGDLDPYLTRGSLGQPEFKYQTASQSVQPLLHSSRQRRYTLKCDALSPLKLPLPWGYEPPSNTWFLGPNQILNPNGIWNGSAVYAQFTAEC